MAAVPLPNVKYRPNIPKKAIEAGASEWTVENLGGIIQNHARRTYDPDHSMWAHIPDRGNPAFSAAAIMQIILAPLMRTRGVSGTGGRGTQQDLSPGQEELSAMQSRIQQYTDEQLMQATVELETLLDTLEPGAEKNRVNEALVFKIGPETGNLKRKTCNRLHSLGSN